MFKVEGRFVLSSDGTYYYEENLERHQPSFPQLQGFLSEPSGKLCVVGVGSVYSGGSKLRLSAVLKLSNINSSNNITDLVTGTLESLDSADDSSYFDPISVLFIPEMNYKYSLSSSGTGCAAGADAPETPSLRILGIGLNSYLLKKFIAQRMKRSYKLW